MGERSAAMGHRANDGRRVQLTIPARPEYITLSRLALAGLARLRPLEEETLADLKLALTEACSNSVRHAYGEGPVGSVEVVYDLGPDRLTIEVVDHGPGFEHVESEEERDLSEGGLGLAIIRALSDEFELVAANGQGSRLRFVKYLPPAH